MNDHRRAAVGGLLALGISAFAVGKRKANPDRDPDDTDALEDPVEVPING
jgi:hypothetical protein